MGSTGTYDALVWGRSTNGGDTFPGGLRVYQENLIDKPSIASSADGNTAYVAYTTHEFGGSQVRVTRLSATGSLGTTVIPSSNGGTNAIVRVDPTKPLNIYVTYQVPTGATDKIVFAASVNGAVSFSNWSEVVTGIAPLPMGTIYAANGYRMRNDIWSHFIIDPGNNHCDVVYESAGRVYFTSSATGLVGSWSVPARLSDNSTTFTDFQPIITASKTRVAVIHFRQTISTAPTVTMGFISTNHGSSWSNQVLSRDGGGVPIASQPCVLPDNSYFGDYIAVAPLAIDSDSAPSPAFYAVWTDSRRGCSVQNHHYVLHAHTMGASFQ